MDRREVIHAVALTVGSMTGEVSGALATIRRNVGAMVALRSSSVFEPDERSLPHTLATFRPAMIADALRKLADDMDPKGTPFDDPPKFTPQERDALDAVTRAGLSLYDYARSLAPTSEITRTVLGQLDELGPGRDLLRALLESARKCRVAGLNP